MKIIKNIPVQGKHQKPILTDLFFLENKQAKDIVIFCHGYKGFKDWGAWNLVAKTFAKQNIFFVKINFSHNGGTVKQPIDFPDLEAFGNNNYTKELDDIDSLLNWISINEDIQSEINLKKITLIGHSRGGGIVTLKAAEDSRITTIVSWAGVSDFGSRFPKKELLSSWKNTGVYHVINGRTKQKMPHYFQFYSNFQQHKKRLNIQKSAKKLNIPHLIIHGNKDTSVSLQEAQNLHKWNPDSTLQIIENANHTFQSAHPWENTFLPKQLELVVTTTVRFLTS